MSYANSALTASVSGDYNDGLPLANLTIAGLTQAPKSVSVSIGGDEKDCSAANYAFQDGVLSITNLAGCTQEGIWSGGDVKISLDGQQEQGGGHGGHGEHGGHWGGQWGHRQGPPWGSGHWECEW